MGEVTINPLTFELLNINWTTLFEGLDIDATWSLFHSIMLQLIDKYVPIQLISPSGPKPMKPIKQKWKPGSLNRYLTLLATYTKFRNLSTATVRDAKYTSKLKTNC